MSELRGLARPGEGESQRPAAGRAEPWLWPIRPAAPPGRPGAEQEPVRLFCFPYAGGGASAFASWRGVAALSGAALWAVQYPGHESRWSEPAASSIDALVEALRTALAGHWRGRYALFGHSFGALVAWELARALDRAGLPAPLRLFVAGARAPDAARPEPIHRLDDAAFMAAVTRYGGIPDAARRAPALLGAALPMLREDFRLIETHESAGGAPLPVALSAFGGGADEEVPADTILGWSRQSIKAFRASFFDGGHFFPFSAPAAVAAAIEEDLAAAASPVRPPA